MQPEAIFRNLADHEVEYVLVGGLAATAYGVNIITVEREICSRQSSENAIRKLREQG